MPGGVGGVQGVLWHLAIIIPFISYTKLSKGRCAYSRAGRVWRELENLIEITVAREACRTLPPHQEKKGIERNLCQAALVAQMVKSPPAAQKTWVQSLGWEDPLEKRMSTYSSILAWRIPWTKESLGYSPWGLKESDRTERLTLTNSVPGCPGRLFWGHSHLRLLVLQCFDALAQPCWTIALDQRLSWGIPPPD